MPNDLWRYPDHCCAYSKPSVSMRCLVHLRLRRTSGFLRAEAATAVEVARRRNRRKVRSHHALFLIDFSELAVNRVRPSPYRKGRIS
jgi:hypothetical protein